MINAPTNRIGVIDALARLLQRTPGENPHCGKLEGLPKVFPEASVVYLRAGGDGLLEHLCRIDVGYQGHFNSITAIHWNVWSVPDDPVVRCYFGPVVQIDGYQRDLR